MYKPRSFIGIVLFLLLQPFLLYLISETLNYVPDSIYYSTARFDRFDGLDLFSCTIYAILALAVWPFLMRYHYIIRSMNLPKKIIVSVITIIITAIISLYGIIDLIFPSDSGVRFLVGHPYCEDSLIQTIERCEGRNFGFLQARLSAVARYGVPVPNIEKSIDSANKLESRIENPLILKPTPCASLAGGFGEKCFAGKIFRGTGDLEYRNVYLFNGKILVLQGSNVNLTADQTKVDEANLDKFLDIERFRP